MYSVQEIDSFHRKDNTFINNLLYDQELYESFVSHIRRSSIIHYNINRQINDLNNFLNNNNNNNNEDDDDSNESSDEEISRFQQYGSDGEWDGEMSEDDSDDNDGNGDHHQRGNQVNDEVGNGNQNDSDRKINHPMEENSNGIPLIDNSIPLICPFTKESIVIPAKTMFCKHDQCFDLDGYIINSCITGHWICPFCSTETGPFNLIIDIRFEHFLQNNLQNLNSSN
ncbi:hypothetical protein ACTFIY_010503 [Dictyostelium cf. discoideum]